MRFGTIAFAIVAVLGVFFLAGRWRSAHLEPIAQVTEASGPDTSFLTTRSGRVHVLDTGGEGDVLLLLHGSGRSVADWQEGLAARLARRHRAIGYDNYGFGSSDRNHGLRYGNALWAQQAIDVLDALAVERAVAVGHSAGGVVAAFLAADHPERIRGAVFVGHGMAMDPMQIVPFVPGLGEIWVSRMTVFGDTFSPQHRSRLEAAYRVRGTRAALLTFIRRQYTIDGLRLLRGTYEDIRVPVLQVHGTRDASIPIDAARRLTPRIHDSRFVEASGVGHDVHVEAPDLLADAIEAFVSTLNP